MTDADRIQELLTQKPGLRAVQIAAELGLDRIDVAAALKGMQAGDVTQDNLYRWWPRASQSPAPPLDGGPRTFLSRLCRYYLECLAQESVAAISLAAETGCNYVEIAQLPFATSGERPPANEREIKRLVQRVRRERGKLALYLGYAVRLRNRHIEPVLLYPVEEAHELSAGYLRPASGIPLFNLEVLRNLAAVDSGNMLDEAVHLSEELGLASAGPDDELPLWDEIIHRLQRCRADWDWREDLDPYKLTQAPALSELTEPGIYNRAILFAATRSPFTYGLENELRKLALLSEKTVGETVLGRLLRGEELEEPPADDRPVLELLPLNTEQRQAVLQGLSAPLTVVTGPPGTGKSQVVISLLANMAWQGGTVLFASKNNHAVDVVEARANELGTHPLLLRLGKEEHQARLAQHLTAGLAESLRPGDAEAYEWLARAHEEGCERFRAIQEEIAAVVALRNEVDELERAAEPARALFGRSLFVTLRTFDAVAFEERLRALSAAIVAARNSAETGVLRRLRDSVETAQEAIRGGKRKAETEEGAYPAAGEASSNRRMRRVAEAGREVLPYSTELRIPLPADTGEEDCLDAWDEFFTLCRERLESALCAQAYWQAFDSLRAGRPLETLAAELSRISSESSANSLELWQRWLRLWPSRWNAGQRRTMSEYISLLQMIASGDHYEEGGSRRVFQRFYSLFPKILAMLPCWGVTSLSARGRLPFEPACFDLVVIDEASQCDIASALPLLFRAKRAVIIGDPFQLKHVSTVAPQHDRLILAAHGLAEGSASWAYSVNSLFDLARGLCRHEDIVNLRDHHRSHRDIIAFSNRHFYRGGLRVATDHDSLHQPHAGGPAVRWVDVKGKVMRPTRGGAVNPVEAEALIGELRRLVIDEGYDGAIGVVTPFRAQANRIRTLAAQDPALSGRLAASQFVVDTVHGFQGDERDVIFFSPVLSLGVGEGTLRFLNGHGNLFNVAITRARSELVVVGDRQAALDSGVKYLASFAEYSQALAAEAAILPAACELGPEYPIVPHPELVSEWERQFYKAMFSAGLRPVPQYAEAPYTLDFALFQGDRKLDIEVDGETYHRNWDGELCRRDQIRTRRLNDQGWDVMRFWVYEIRDDLNGALGRVKAWLEGV